MIKKEKHSILGQRLWNFLFYHYTLWEKNRRVYCVWFKIKKWYKNWYALCKATNTGLYVILFDIYKWFLESKNWKVPKSEKKIRSEMRPQWSRIWLQNTEDFLCIHYNSTKITHKKLNKLYLFNIIIHQNM